MSAALLEQTRAWHEEIESLERLLVKDLHRDAKSHRERLHQNHRVNNMAESIVGASQKLVSLCLDPHLLHCFRSCFYPAAIDILLTVSSLLSLCLDVSRLCLKRMSTAVPKSRPSFLRSRCVARGFMVYPSWVSMLEHISKRVSGVFYSIWDVLSEYSAFPLPFVMTFVS
jgi:hypothetical protein